VLHRALPGLHAVGGAPDRDRPGGALERQQEGVDGEVVEAGDLGLEPAAVRAGRVAEDHEAAPSLAVHGADRVVERQGVERDRCRR
jgi:hypothetical protein